MKNVTSNITRLKQIPLTRPLQAPYIPLVRNGNGNVTVNVTVLLLKQRNIFIAIYIYIGKSKKLEKEKTNDKSGKRNGQDRGRRDNNPR